VSPPGTMSRPFDALELELRQIPGVQVVCFGERGDARLVQLGAEEEADEAELRRHAAAVADAHLDEPHVIEVVGAGRRPSEAARVRVLAVITLPDDEVEVHLAKGGRRTIGRARGDPVKSAVASVLEALVALGLRVPFRPGWSGALGEPSGQAIAVSLESHDGTTTRWGVAVGPSPEEAAVRATLDALNRHLADRREL
jgi:hypothetical protein